MITFNHQDDLSVSLFSKGAKVVIEKFTLGDCEELHGEPESFSLPSSAFKKVCTKFHNMNSSGDTVQIFHKGEFLLEFSDSKDAKIFLESMRYTDDLEVKYLTSVKTFLSEGKS